MEFVYATSFYGDYITHSPNTFMGVGLKFKAEGSMAAAELTVIRQ